MSTRFDHAGAAMGMLRDAQDASDLLVLAAITAGAQVHATLALVEQQRIANLIAYLGVDVIGGGSGSSGALDDIEKGLGL